MENLLLGVITRKHYGSTATQSISHLWTSSVKFCRITNYTWRAVTDTWDGHHSVPLRHHAISLLELNRAPQGFLSLGDRYNSGFEAVQAKFQRSPLQQRLRATLVKDLELPYLRRTDRNSAQP